MPVKVAILGGGMGGMAAAWHLSQDPNIKVTVFQRDGLLGGKCASTRSSNANKGERIEEHGIHLLMGFYDQALSMLRDCYATPGLTGVLPWADAFTPADAVTMSSKPDGTNWEFWTVNFPPNNLPIGGDGKPAKVEDLLRGAFRWLLAFLSILMPQLTASPFVIKVGNGMAVLFAFLLKLAAWGLPVGWLFNIVRWWLDKVVLKLWPMVQPLLHASAQVRHLWIGVWLIATNLRGLIVDGIVLPPHNFSVIDGYDYRDWLKLRSVVSPPNPEMWWNCPPVRALYDIAFADAHALAAGIVVYNALNIALDYKGHFAYRMNAGMGETVFTPLFKVLQARGVDFRFFHEVTGLHPGVDGLGRPVIDRVDLAVRPVPGPHGPVNNSSVRLPDTTVINVNTWPENPASATLPPSQVKHLVRSGPVGPNQEQFDVFVLAISVGGLPAICGPLLAVDPGFWAMIVTQRGLQTQSTQVWLDKKPTSFGAPGSAPTVISFERPYNSCVDMAQTLDSEHWPIGGKPQAVAYLCDELPEADTIGQPDPTLVVRNQLETFLVNHASGMWPGFTLADLHDPSGGAGVARINFQYWRANVDRSDRYVIPVPGTTALRRGPAESGFHNLGLAGDWVRTGLNSGCVEAAVIAGEAAAKAIRAGKIS